MEIGNLPKGWKISEPYSVPKQGAYVNKMVAELMERRPEKRNVPTHFNGKPIAELTAQERSEFILSLQAPSTKKLMLAQKERSPSEDAEYQRLLRETPIPKEAQVRDEFGKVDVGTRSIVDKDGLILKDVELLSDARRREKNTLGQSTKSSASDERKEKAAWAFTYSKPANPTSEDLDRLKKLDQIKAVIAEAETPKREISPSLWQRFKMRFWGNGYRWNNIEERKRLGLDE